MSLRTFWERRARYFNRIATFNRLRKAAWESNAVDHIMVSETIRPDGIVVAFGANAPLCSAAFVGMRIKKVQPYITSSPRTCDKCLAEIRARNLGATTKIGVGV